MTVRPDAVHGSAEETKASPTGRASVTTTLRASEGPLLVVRTSYSYSWPGTVGPAPSGVLTVARSDTGSKGPGGSTGSGLLLAGSGSVASELPVALLPRSDPSPWYEGLSRAWKLQLLVSPAASCGSGPHVTVCATAVQPSEEPTKEIPLGSLSVAVTFRATDGPLFLAVSV